MMGNCCSETADPVPPAVSREEMNEYIDGLVAATPVPNPSDERKPPAPPPGSPDLELYAAEREADFSFEGQRFLAKIVDVYDGDTVRVTFRYAGKLTQYRARMAGYDSPEMRPPKTKPGRDEEVKAAHRAKDALISKLGDRIVYIGCGPFDKYGRLLVTVYARAGPGLTENGENVNQWMIANGHGVPYDGGTKIGFVAPRDPNEGEG